MILLAKIKQLFQCDPGLSTAVKPMSFHGWPAYGKIVSRKNVPIRGMVSCASLCLNLKSSKTTAVWGVGAFADERIWLTSRLLRDRSDACTCLISVTLGSPSGCVVSFSHDSGRVRAKVNMCFWKWGTGAR